MPAVLMFCSSLQPASLQPSSQLHPREARARAQGAPAGAPGVCDHPGGPGPAAAAPRGPEGVPGGHHRVPVTGLLPPGVPPQILPGLPSRSVHKACCFLYLLWLWLLDSFLCTCHKIVRGIRHPCYLSVCASGCQFHLLP